MRLRSKRFIPLVVAVSVLCSPGTASARFMDWIAWLEELSGPGPFRGIEFSFEVACAQVGHKRQLTAATKGSNAYANALTDLGLSDLAPARTSSRQASSDLRSNDLALARTSQLGSLAYLERLEAALEREYPGLASERSARVVVETDNCALNRRKFVRQLHAERLEALSSLRGPTEAPTDVPYSGPVVGLVLGVGRYVSIENKLADQDAKRSDRRVTAVFYDLLLHSKISPVFDVGAGVGLSHFSGHGVSGDHFSFVRPHVVPLSLVVKPLALISDNRLTQGLGTRVAARLLPYSLDGADFGAPGVPFSQAGELLWGASVYIDVGTLVWGTGGR